MGFLGELARKTFARAHDMVDSYPVMHDTSTVAEHCWKARRIVAMVACLPPHLRVVVVVVVLVATPR